MSSLLASIWPSTAALSTPARALPPDFGVSSRVSWQSSRLGSIDSLERVTAEVPTLKADEVVVGVRAIGLNFADIFCCLGLYEAANKMLDEGGGGGALCPGLEFSGEVQAVGSAVTRVAPGDRVFGFSRFGAYRTIVVTRDEYLRPVPSGWTFAEAASLLAQGLTAWHGLVPLGAVKKGSRVLVHSAAGGVGCAAMQICQALGCPATGVVGSEAKAPFLRERYPEATVVVRGPERKWLTLVPGYLTRPRLDPGQLVGTNRAVMGFNLIWLTERVDMLTAELDEMLSKGGLLERPPAVGKEFSFDELPQALHYLNSGTSVGKVVVVVGED